MTKVRFGNAASILHKNGYAPLPIRPNSKSPAVKEWSEAKIDVVVWKRKYAEYGVGLRGGDNGLVALDIDVEDEKIADAVERCFPATIVRFGRAPRRILLFRTDVQSKTVLATHRGNQQIDWRPRGHQCVAFGSHPDTKQEYYWRGGHSPLDTPVTDLPFIVRTQLDEIVDELSLIVDTRKVPNEQSSDEDWLANVKTPRADIKRTDIEKALEWVDPDVERDIWMRIGMALHHQYEGRNEGLDLFIEWSAGGEKYVEGDCEERWKSYRRTARNGKMVTIDYLLVTANRAREAEEQARCERAYRRIVDEIEDCETTAQLEAAAESARKAKFDELSIERVVREIQSKYKAITGAPLRVALARQLVKSAPERNTVMPEWCKPWVYLRASGRFYNHATRASCSRETFDFEHGGTIDGERMSDIARNAWGLRVVEDWRYAPGEDLFFEDDFGTEFVNSYSDIEVPEIVARYSSRDLDNIEAMQFQFRLLCDNDSYNVDILISWLAYCIKHPGRKIRWAPFISSFPGLGKTWLYQLMCTMMGKSNCFVVGPSAIKEKFNGYLENRCFLLMNEIKLHGPDSKDILNSIKPWITDEDVNIRRMNHDTFLVKNNANILVMSNYADGVPIEQDDRRYFVVSSIKVSPEEQMQWSKDHKTHHEKLFAALQQSPGAIRKWFLNYKLHPDFEPDGRAPETQSRASLISMAKSDEQIAVEEIIETGGEGVTSEVISSSHLALLLELRGFPVRTVQLNRLLINQGYTQMGIIKWKNRAVRIWVKGNLRDWNNEKIRKTLEN